MEARENEELTEKAEGLLRHRRNGDYMAGDVGCALITDRNNVYLGVCIDTISGMGFCAEHSAIAAMVTSGESRIKRLVAVWKDGKGSTRIIPPCGRCREFIRQVDNNNLETDVIIASGRVVKLKDLLPYYDWPG
jgi:cytidine deaminase